MHLDLENKTDIIIENELIDKLRFAKNIVLFGAGQTGDYFFEILKQYGINIKLI